MRPRLGPISFIFMQFSGKDCQIICFRPNSKVEVPFWKILDSPLDILEIVLLLIMLLKTVLYT